MTPFDQAWQILKMPPKPDFPYYGDPEEFYMQHSISPRGESGPDILNIAATQGFEGFNERRGENLTPMHYGTATFDIHDDKLVPRFAQVKPAFRRGGIATDMYDHAEKVTGLPVVDEALVQSEAAEKFWDARREKTGVEKPDWKQDPNWRRGLYKPPKIKIRR